MKVSDGQKLFLCGRSVCSVSTGPERKHIRLGGNVNRQYDCVGERRVIWPNESAARWVDGPREETSEVIIIGR